MTKTALDLLIAGIEMQSEFNAYVSGISGLPVTVTTDIQSATPPCAMITMQRAEYGIGGGEGGCLFQITLILPLFASLDKVLHATDLFAGTLYERTLRSRTGVRLTGVTVSGVEESADRPGVWVVSVLCEFKF